MTVPPLPPRFLNWRLEDGKKLPCDRHGGTINAHNQAYHVDYATAASAPYGVAYALREEDGWFFLDLDKCAVDGAWTPQATAIFSSFNGAWGEVSQSGTGLHIIGRCDPSRLKDRRNKWDGWLEFYTGERFIAFGPTGWQPIGNAASDTDWTDQLLRLVPQRQTLGNLPDGIDPSYTGPEDDDALIDVMLRSSGGAAAAFGAKATVADLWNADAAKLAQFYPAYDGNGGFDRSSADAALMWHLAFWTGKDMPRMDRLFRRSGLMRDKYQKRKDYRNDTIQGAARGCNQVYDKPRPEPQVNDDGYDVFLTIADMKEYFKGCIYVRDAHRVLTPDGSMLRSEQFNASYSGHMFTTMPDGTKPTDLAFDAFTRNKSHRFPWAKNSVFRPKEPGGVVLPDGTVNTYIDPQVVMIKGDASPFLTLLSKLLPDERDRAILLNYLAAIVQNPGVKFQWAPVLQGCEGNGKTAVFSTVAYAVGRQYAHMPKAKYIGGQFNSYVEGKLFILVEEVHMNGRRDVLDDLKPLITNLDIEVENKGVDKRMIENVANWAFCSNYKDAVLKSRNDRRYAVFFTAQQSYEDIIRDGMGGDFFPDLYRWLRADGYAIVADYLRNFPIDPALDPAGSCHRAPKTSSTDEAISASMGGIEAEIIEASENNTQGFRGGWCSTHMLDRLLRSKGYKISRNKQAEILVNLGYEKVGRSVATLINEDNTRPTLYRKPGADADYARAQNYPV